MIKGRIDCFKGLTTAAVKQIYKENDYVVQEKQAAILRDQNEERSHTDYQALLQSHLDKTFEEEYLARRQARQEQALYLQKQAQEQAQSHSLLQQDKFGKIDGGYYSNFGKSCR